MPLYLLHPHKSNVPKFLKHPIHVYASECSDCVSADADAGFENEIYSPGVARVCGMKKYSFVPLRARGEAR